VLTLVDRIVGFRHARAQPERAAVWRRAILARRPMNVAVLAQAAKTARTAWAVPVSGAPYREPVAAGAAAQPHDPIPPGKTGGLSKER
jgi:hypothetical protein